MLQNKESIQAHLHKLYRVMNKNAITHETIKYWEDKLETLKNKNNER